MLSVKRLNLGIIFGGMSTEHDVSIVSGTSVLRNLDTTKYRLYPIYLAKDGSWYEYDKKLDEIQNFQVGDQIAENLKPISNVMEYLKQLDVVFPILHGRYGEDGAIQGLLELLKIPYVGCNILGSAVGMDKVYSKIIFEKANIKQAPYCYIRKHQDHYIFITSQFDEQQMTLEEVIDKIEKKLAYPVFVKPSNSGSSVGINKAKTKEELAEAILEASKYDLKIVIEASIYGREVECAVLGNEEVIASCVGEIIPAEEFYNYDAKYMNGSSQVLIPADITKQKQEEIKKIAIKAYKAIDGKGLSRVDFFIDKDTQEVVINEINTMPGFTEISMYPKLFAQDGIAYSDLLDQLINLAMEGK